VKTDSRITAYLDRVVSRVRWRGKRAAIREELLAHLEDSVSARIEAGADQDRAIQEAISEMGEAHVLGKALSRSNAPSYLALPFLFAYGISLMIIALLFASHELSVQANRVFGEMKAGIQMHEEKFFADQKVLSSEPFFAFPGQKFDAGPYLNDRVAWSGLEREPYRQLHYRPVYVVEKMKFAQDWPAHSNDPSLPVVDLSWMARLSDFDHWDIYGSGVVGKTVLSNPHETWASVPILDYQVLQQYARLRLMKGIRERKLLSALREVRRLNHLIYSNEILVGSMVSVALLNLERTAYEYGVKHQLIAAGDWKPMSADTTLRARRAMFGFAQAFQFFTDAEFMARAFDGHSTAGYCSALSEGMLTGSAMRPFANDPYAFEVDLRPKIDLMNRIADQSREKCSLSLAHVFWENPDRAFNWLQSGDTFRDKLRYVGIRLPLVRQFLIFWIAEIATPSYLAAYNNLHLSTE
jgi:hypothetical protein